MKVDPKPPDESVESARKTRTFGDQVIRWGAIATALTAIVGVVALLFPEGEPTLDARLDALDIQSEVTFADFEGRQVLAAARWDSDMALAASAVEQPSPLDPGSGEAFLRAGKSAREPVLESLAVERSRATVELPKGCRFSAASDEIECETAQPLSWAAADQQTVGPGGTADEVIASAREFLRVLRDTRRRTITRDGERVIEPLGVTVSFEAVVAGYRGEQLDVRWSLHRTGSEKPVSRDWLANRRVLSFEPKANTQRIAQEFWVPLPRDRASSHIRVTLYGPDDEPITRRDTKRFR